MSFWDHLDDRTQLALLLAGVAAGAAGCERAVVVDPVPADARPGLVAELTLASPSGEATMVCAPFNTTVLFHSLAALRAAFNLS